MGRVSEVETGLYSIASSRALDASILRAARLSLMTVSLLALTVAAIGLWFAVPGGAITGFGISLTISCVVFSVVLLLLLVAWPLDRLAPISITATAYYGSYLSAGVAHAVLTPGNHETLFVYLIWFIPLQAFNKTINKGRSSGILAWAILVMPIMILVVLSPTIAQTFPPSISGIPIVFALAHVSLALLLNNLRRYREAFISEHERATSFQFAAEILENISESFLLLDRAFRLLYLNKAACHVLGVLRTFAEGKPIAQATPQFASPVFMRSLEEVWTEARPRQLQLYAESTGRWYEVRCTPGKNDMSLYFQDVTERLARDEKLRRNEMQFRIAGRLSRMGAWEYRLLDGAVIWSDQVAEILEMQPGSLRDLDEAISFYTPEWRPRVFEVVKQCVEEGSPFDEEFEIVTATGRKLWVRAIGQAVRNAGGAITGAEGAFQDITSQHAAREALRAGQVRLAEQAEVLDKSNDSIIVRDIEGRVIYWNQSSERIYGLPSEQAVGRPIHEVLRIDPKLSEEATAKVLASGGWRRIVTLIAMDGRKVIADSHLSLIRDEAGRPKSIVAISVDVTERLAIEERLRQTERLDALGQLTGGVAHDFNNLLTVIMGNSEVLVEDLADREDMRLLARMTQQAAQRGAALTRQLLAFARRQPLEASETDVSALLSEMRALLKRTLREDLELVVVGAETVWSIIVDPAQLESAILNLCLNARDAMPNGGRLLIESANARLDQDYADLHADVIVGDYVLISVTDSGVGIPAENLQRVFEPFFTTKPFGKGTGLGLSMVYGLIKQSRGHIAIYSELGHGTCVKMYLPRAPDGSGAVDKDPVAPAAPEGSEAILLVEDDELVRRNVQHQLLSLGYRVTTAADGREGLELVRSGEHFDLLFTDVIMPGGLDGPGLARAACALRPTLRLLFTSGYTENAIVGSGRLNGGAHILYKPYVRAELARKVRAALTEPRQ